MAIFANILSLDTCLIVLDRLILLKEAALIDIIKHVFKQMKGALLALCEPAKGKSKNGSSGNAASGDRSAQLQAYLVRLIYVEAESNNNLFPALYT